MREVGSGLTDSGCTLAVMAIIGRNQSASGSDPACLLVIYMKKSDFAGFCLVLVF